MPNKKHILLLTDLIEGGELAATLSLFGELYETKRVTLSLIAFGKSYGGDLSIFDKTVFLKHSIAFRPLSFIKRLLLDFRKTVLAIKGLEGNKDLNLIVSTNSIMILASLFAIRNPDVTKIFYFHGIKRMPYQYFWQTDYRQVLIKMIEKLAFILSSTVLVPSNYSKRFVQGVVYPFRKRDILVVPNLVPKIFFKEISERSLSLYRATIKLRKGEKIVLYSGRIARYKGLENLVEGFYLARKNFSNLILIFAHPHLGTNRETYKNIMSLINKFGMRKYVYFINDLTKENLAKLYQISGVTILPSELEFAPMSIIESMAGETLAIATDKGNVRDVLSKVDKQLILKNNSPIEIRDKLIYVFNLSSMRRRSLAKKSKQIAILLGRNTRHIEKLL